MRNLRALTDEELLYLTQNYHFENLGKYIVVSFTGDSRKTKTVHDSSEGFSISSKVRRINISKDAIDLWADGYDYEGYSLIEVQNAINTLIVTYQDLTKEGLDSQLKTNHLKLKTERK